MLLRHPGKTPVFAVTGLFFLFLFIFVLNGSFHKAFE